MMDPVSFWTVRSGLRHEVWCWSCGLIALFRFRWLATWYGRYPFFLRVLVEVSSNDQWDFFHPKRVHPKLLRAMEGGR